MNRLDVRQARRARLDEAAEVHAEVRRTLAATRDWLKLEVNAALDAGMSESEAARRAGVTRMTIRAWRN